LIKKLLRTVYERIHLKIKGWVTDEDGIDWINCKVHGLTRATPEAGYRKFISCQSCVDEKRQLTKMEESKYFCV